MYIYILFIIDLYINKYVIYNLYIFIYKSIMKEKVMNFRESSGKSWRCKGWSRNDINTVLMDDILKKSNK